MLIGYMRPSHEDPGCRKQINELMKYKNIKLIKEEHGLAKKRTQLADTLHHLEKGDKIIVTNLVVLADSTRHLADILHSMEEKQAFLYSIKEDLDTGSSHRYSFFEIVKHLMDFQSDLISERTKTGLLEAKEKGIPTGRPKKPDENVQRAISMYESKNYSLAEIKNETGISKSTLYRYLDRLT